MISLLGFVFLNILINMAWDELLLLSFDSSTKEDGVLMIKKMFNGKEILYSLFISPPTGSFFSKSWLSSTWSLRLLFYCCFLHLRYMFCFLSLSIYIIIIIISPLLFCILEIIELNRYLSWRNHQSTYERERKILHWLNDDIYTRSDFYTCNNREI